MWLMLQQENPDDFVIATGVTHSVREFVLMAMEIANLGTDLDKYVTYDKEMKRPAEVDLLVGDASKAEKYLGWKPKVALRGLIEIMLENDLKLERDSLN
jgi:GDPmannose 4,6-dehydratase